MKRIVSLIILCLMLIAPVAAQDDDLTHIPSPEWRDQVIYFLMIDRFNDGDTSNNDQGADEFDPDDRRKFQGGDLQGIIDRVDYIQGLGATAIWITPPVSNQWWDPMVEFGGYHGYWAENFMEIDPHFGDTGTYRALSQALHANEMYLIQDIVTNHTGNFFSYANEWDPDDPTVGYTPNTNTVPVIAPRQEPFQLNDATNPAHLEADIYHWTPPITDYQNPEQRLDWSLADLDDLNTENAVVRDALKDAYTHWIREVGVDGFRIDTVIYVEHEFWNDFIHSDDGVNAAAQATGRDNFLTFGEAFIGSEPYDDAGEREIVTYLGTDDAPEMTSVLNFPLHFTIGRVFAEGAPTSQMTYRLQAAAEIFPDPSLLPVFIDNHDVDRFLQRGSLDGLKQSLMFMLTTPGIPVIYYGTEQAFVEQRGSMFAEGWGSNGENHFNTDSEMYTFIADLTTMRTSNRIFTRGSLEVLADSDAGPGVFAYKRDYEGETALVIFNTSDRPSLLNNLETGLPANTVLSLAYGLSQGEDIVVGAEGRITMELAPREGMILRTTGETAEETAAADPDEGAVTIDDALSGKTYSDDITVSGTISTGNTIVKVAVNDILLNANTTTADADGNWSLTLPINSFPLGETEQTFTAFSPALRLASDPVTVTTDVTLAMDNAITVSDPRDDDNGPYGIYTLPQDSTFTDQLDIVGATVVPFGANLMVSIEMAEVTTIWNPPNGFDHVTYHIYVDIPGRDGATVLPNINAELSEGFDWDVMAFADGWNNRLYTSEGAAADNYGTNTNPAPEITTEGNTVNFLFDSASLGNPQSLDGVQVYIALWDWNGPDASYRSLTTPGAQWGFGGAEAAEGYPLIIDDVAVNWNPETTIQLDEEVLAELAVPESTVTFEVTVPENTPDDAVLYMVGDFNAMNPNDANFQFEKTGEQQYTLTKTLRAETEISFRLTRGSWRTAEVIDPNDRFAERDFTVPDSDTVVELTVESWQDQ